MNIAQLDISNVLLYIGDAVRYDGLDKRINKLGVTFKTVSQSIHTPTSFASIFTGCIPPRTGVYWFRDRLPASLDTLLNLEGHNTDFVHTDSALQRTTGGPLATALRAGETSKALLEYYEEPFVWIERGPGGHAPYSRKPMKKANEYWNKTLPASQDTLKSDYRGAICRDWSVFKDRLNTLKERDDLDDTLIIYASDHGECLGEYGILGHNGPIVPEVVYTPTVFIHPELEDRFGGTIRNIDLYPTIRSLLDYRKQEHIDGKPIWDLSEPIRGTVHYSHGFDIAYRYGKKVGRFEKFMNPIFDQHGLFDQNGGQVKRFNSDASQLQILTGKMSLSPLATQYRRTPAQTSKSFMKRRWMCGLPNFEFETALETVRETKNQEQISKMFNMDINTEDLEALGYI